MLLNQVSIEKRLGSIEFLTAVYGFILLLLLVYLIIFSPITPRESPVAPANSMIRLTLCAIHHNTVHFPSFCRRKSKPFSILLPQKRWEKTWFPCVCRRKMAGIQKVHRCRRRIFCLQPIRPDMAKCQQLLVHPYILPY